MIKYGILLILCLIIVGSQMGIALGEDNLKRHLVLVGNKDLNTPPLTHRDIRRIFLGANKKTNIIDITPIGNATDSFLYQVFLQKIVSMSARTYERHLLTKVYKKGNKRLPFIKDREQLRRALKNSNTSITFMWSNEVPDYQNVKILQTIWWGTTEQ